jgi:hypothetical protein
MRLSDSLIHRIRGGVSGLGVSSEVVPSSGVTWESRSRSLSIAVGKRISPWLFTAHPLLRHQTMIFMVKGSLYKMLLIRGN